MPIISNPVMKSMKKWCEEKGLKLRESDEPNKMVTEEDFNSLFLVPSQLPELPSEFNEDKAPEMDVTPRVEEKAKKRGRPKGETKKVRKP